MRGVLAPIPCLVAALALAGCMGRTAPVAMAPQANLDTIAYGQSYAGPAPMPVAYAAPAPVYDAAYHLDAGDKLRVVVYGQEGLTNTYAIDAGGSITMPLIGSVPARGRTPAGLAADIAAKLRGGFIREPSVAVEIEAYRPFFILGEVAAPGQYPYVAQHDGRKRGCHRRRVFAARTPRPGDGHPHRCRRNRPLCGAARHLPQPGRYGARRRTLVLIMPMVEGQPLRILHATRAPVGGIFRHILDLANGQADRGHHVGIIADSLTGGERAEQALAEIAPRLKLGVHRVAIHREPLSYRCAGMGAIPAPGPATETGRPAWPRRQGRRLHPDEDRASETIRVYTPHGGSLHYPLTTLKGRIYARLERALMDSNRSVPVRERVCARHLSAHHRHPEGPGALRVQRRHRQ